jgi:hypothetical protein
LKYHNYGFDGGKNTKKITLLLIATLVINTGFLSGCEKKSSIQMDSRFFGNWYNESIPDIITTYFSDGTYEISPMQVSGTWETKDGKLISLVSNEPDIIKKSYYSFTNNNNTLTLTDVDSGYSVIQIKQ